MVNKRNSLRGQAFIVFETREQMIKAQERLNNFPFFGKNLKMEAARSTSFAYLIHKGEFILKNYKDDYETRKAVALNQALLQKRKQMNAESLMEEDRFLKVRGFPPKFSLEKVRFLLSSLKGVKQLSSDDFPEFVEIEFHGSALCAVAQKILHGLQVQPDHPLEASIHNSECI